MFRVVAIIACLQPFLSAQAPKSFVLFSLYVGAETPNMHGNNIKLLLLIKNLINYF